VITRRSVLQAGCIGLVVAHGLSRGQPVATIRRVGWLSIGSKTSPADVYAAFKQGMRDFGWIEGKNVEYRFVYADGELNRLDAVASELTRQQVDVIVVGNALTTRALQRATNTIPIVMATVSDPVGNKFVASLGKPGGNITGVTAQQEEVLGKRIAILHDVAPGARRVAVLLNESNPSYAVYWAAAQNTALLWISLRFALSPARPRNSALPSERSFGNDRRPS
jgi:putative ABC transport system substrate-binding protein